MLFLQCCPVINFADLGLKYYNDLLENFLIHSLYCAINGYAATNFILMQFKTKLSECS